MDLQSETLCTKDAAAYLRISPSTLANLRSQGKGPVFRRLTDRKFGNVLYRKEDLDAWVEANIVVPGA